MISWDRYTIKKSRYPNSFYNVFEIKLFGIVVFRTESHDKLKY